MKKLIVKCVAFLLIIGGLTASFLISKPRSEVNADTPSTFSYDVSYNETQNLIEFYIYVLDAYQSITTDTCGIDIYYANKTPPYYFGGGNETITFVRLTSGDKTDYDCYVGYRHITTGEENSNVMYRIFTTQLRWDNTQVCDNTMACFSPFNIEVLREQIYNGAYDDGYQDGTNDRNAYWDDYIQDTYESTTGSGYQRIFEVGRTAGYRQGQDSLNTMEWFETTASGVSSILQLKLLPSITIGALIFIPLMFFILKGVLWIWRRN